MNDQDHIDYRSRSISPWSKKHKFARLLWSIVQGTLFRYSFHNMYRWRAWLLRRFGAKIGQHTVIRRTASITIPWNLTLGDWSALGDHVIIYALGPITIGSRVSISQYSHLCAGTHDFARLDLPLLTPPIVIGDDTWVCADVFIGPDVTIGDRCVIGARSSVHKDVAPGKVAVGNPAKAIKNRRID